MKRLAPPATPTRRRAGLRCLPGCDLDALHAQALELILRRAGLRTLALTRRRSSPADWAGRCARSNPSAVVLTGRRVSLDAIGRLVYAVRSVVHGVVVFDYRGAVPDTGASTVVPAR